ncbi:hypothetical protein QPK87_07050 [Kamptonema cortianum]|nr:hypothetical protein [Geitlerinema splendidum]MDK3156331.1 hypothetical protein [Kamptonema cortianum]
MKFGVVLLAFVMLVGCGVRRESVVSTKDGRAVVSDDGSVVVEGDGGKLEIDKDGNYKVRDENGGTTEVSGNLKSSFPDSVFVIAPYPDAQPLEFGSVESKMSGKTMYSRVWTTKDGVSKVGKHFLDEAKKHGEIVGGELFAKLNDEAMVIPIDLKSGARCQVHVSRDKDKQVTSISMHYSEK